ncbi:IS200/IS605 family transposase [Candidatus Nomurabacteria bacterium]|nr:IS200/IS605 family transposase [Candidatus Kaiserbacteria bacterium]MCB9814014.1 IS200/IS605 family transposase [Candidatus Nomurabacteria bacterium]MCB9814047.1 IS200/IS605 family transposase [Candidatus Nomurabacteria bacterium]MCB9814108.1 IS200/IS605 family transposase [Candidatus Nomurabacteria bacterium]MCB9814696.1 IS200/IS605 family transposase [Candidatus Nomurabacteria bacterium]
MKTQYKKLSHTVWLCTYHIVFCPKYRYKILEGKAEVLVRNYFYQLCGRKDQVTIEEINIQPDHVHMIISIPPKYSISDMMGYLKGKTALKLFQEQKTMTKRYWGRHLWSRGYCVSSVGLNEEQIRKYVKWQQERDSKG